MERVSNDGERRPVTPSEIAQIDQMEALYQNLTARFLTMRAQLKQAAMDGDNKLMGRLTAELEEAFKEQWPNPDPSMINMIMHLFGVIEQARTWSEHIFAVNEISLRLLASLQRPGHPVYSLPGFDPERLDDEVSVVAEVLDGMSGESGLTFTTDTGVDLTNIHPADACEGPFCVVHKPAPGPWDDWDTHWREDWGLMVRICRHDVHHVAIEERMRNPLLGMLRDDHPGGCDCPCDFSRVDTLTDAEGRITGFRAKE